MQKKHLLLITAQSTAKIQILAYLSSLFYRHLTLSSVRIEDATESMINSADCLLYTTENVQLAFHKHFSVPQSTYELICSRTFNHTYLTELLTIPKHATVYVINDFEASSISVINLLQKSGFSNYHFVPYFPGCNLSTQGIQYAVTVGDLYLTPTEIPNIIDIGSRVPDIATINQIITYFQLDPHIANEVTHSYLRHTIQLLRLSHNQLVTTLNSKHLLQLIIDHFKTPVCIINGDYKIYTANLSFRDLFFTEHSSKEYLPPILISELIGKNFNMHVTPSISTYDHEMEEHISDSAFIDSIQEINYMNEEPLFLIRISQNQNKEQDTHKKDFFRNFKSNNPHMIEVCKAACQLSLANLNIIITGEDTREQQILIHMIHNNSHRQNANFFNLSPSIANSSDTTLLQQLLYTNNHGTLHLSCIDEYHPSVQQHLLDFLRYGIVVNQTLYPLDVRVIASSTKKLTPQIMSPDLFYFLNTTSIEILPLRERPEDIELLLYSFFKEFFSTASTPYDQTFSDPLKAFLLSYSWPGNTVEMQSLFEYLSCIYQNRLLQLHQLPPYLVTTIASQKNTISDDQLLVLSILQGYPGIGRSTISKISQSTTTPLSEGKVRTILATLAKNNYINVHKTKGGCSLSELGLLSLKSLPPH